MPHAILAKLLEEIIKRHPLPWRQMGRYFEDAHHNTIGVVGDGEYASIISQVIVDVINEKFDKKDEGTPG